MAVLIEAISVVIRRDAIERSVPEGWTGFLKVVPNSTLCTDGELARVGFMSPDTVGEFIHELEQLNLRFLEEGSFVDIAVVDQQKGPTTTCEWLEFGRLPVDGGEVSACWLFEGSRLAGAQGIHFKPGPNTDLALKEEGGQTRFSHFTTKLVVPNHWTYEHSLSKEFERIPLKELREKLEFLRIENGLKVYRDLNTGDEVFGDSVRTDNDGS